MRHTAVWGLLVMFVLTFAGTAVAQQPQEKKVGSFTLTKTADKMTDEDRSRAITCGENQKGALIALSLFSIAQRRAAPGGVLSACAKFGAISRSIVRPYGEREWLTTRMDGVALRDGPIAREAAVLCQ